MSTLSDQLQNELDEAAQHLRTALEIAARTEKSHVIQQISTILSSIEYCQFSRSSEKRIFYIDVGNMPKDKVEQYMREVISRYRTKMNYNSTTGEVDTSC